MLKLYVLTFVLLSALSLALGSDEGRATMEVLNKLKDPQNYNAAVRPTRNGEPTEVNIQLYIRSIYDIDETKMQASIDLTFRMTWEDPRLTFRQGDVGYVNILDPHLAWLPDAFFKNAITTQLESVHPESYLRVFPDGKVIYSTRLILRQRCPMSFKSFPHDSQNCAINVASYGFTAAQVFFAMDENAVQISKNLFLEKFMLRNFTTKALVSTTSTGDYSSFEVSLILDRESAYYILVWYVPLVNILVLCWASLFIKNQDFLAKLLLSLLPFLSMVFFASSLNSTLPQANYTRAIDVFSGLTVTAAFGVFVHTIVTYVRRGGSADAGLDDNDSGAKATLKKYLLPALHVGGYALFIVIYAIVFSV